MHNTTYHIGVDPGYQGGITVLNANGDFVEIYSMPTIKQKMPKNKTKTSYDLKKIVSILQKYKDNNVYFAIEKVGPRPLEGTVSSFNFGMGYGQLQGIAQAFNFEIVMIPPQTWKKVFPELITSDFESLKEQAKKIKLENKELERTISEKNKDEQKQIKESIKSNKKEIESLNRKVKKEAKSQSRNLAAKLFPSLKDQFVKTNEDGKSDSLLIAVYAQKSKL